MKDIVVEGSGGNPAGAEGKRKEESLGAGSKGSTKAIKQVAAMLLEKQRKEGSIPERGVGRQKREITGKRRGSHSVRGETKTLR